MFPAKPTSLLVNLKQLPDVTDAMLSHIPRIPLFDEGRLLPGWKPQWHRRAELVMGIAQTCTWEALTDSGTLPAGARLLQITETSLYPDGLIAINLNAVWGDRGELFVDVGYAGKAVARYTNNPYNVESYRERHAKRRLVDVFPLYHDGDVSRFYERCEDYPALTETEFYQFAESVVNFIVLASSPPEGAFPYAGVWIGGDSAWISGLLAGDRNRRNTDGTAP